MAVTTLLIAVYASCGFALGKGPETVHFHGQIKFPESAPKEFPPNSHLYVSLDETSLQDTRSQHIASTELDMANYHHGKPMEYSIDAKKDKIVGRFDYPAHIITVSATLNVDWTRSGEKWIRKGDYLTTTSFDIHYDASKSSNEKDISLVHYT